MALTYGKSREYLLEECFPADVIIPPMRSTGLLRGPGFGILQLPGHSAGHIGVVTPDGAAYLGDCLIDEEQIAAAKLPTSMFIAGTWRARRACGISGARRTSSPTSRC